MLLALSGSLEESPVVLLSELLSVPSELLPGLSVSAAWSGLPGVSDMPELSGLHEPPQLPEEPPQLPEELPQLPVAGILFV